YRQYPYPAGLKMISRDRYYRAKYDHEPPAPPNHHRGRSRISIHEDTDGDGRYDAHKVFLDGLDLANAALPDHDGVWVMHTPYLVFYPDADRDDEPDGDPEVHLAGFGFEDTHSVANGLVWGPDGWIYGGQGSTVASRIRVVGGDGEEDPGVYFEGCMVWRYRPETRTFEIFAEGGGNVFGLEFDSDGRLYSGHNGGGTRGWHYVQGAYHLKQGRQVTKFGPPGNPYAFGELPMMRTDDKIIRFSHNTIVCEGTAVPTRMQGRFLAADPLHHFLVLSERTKRGATFETKDAGHPLRSDDKRFRPVYLTNAPDGSIHVADFYEEFIAHGQHYQSQIDPGSGRVYRLRGKESRLVAEIDMRAMDAAELVKALDHPNKWHRQMAVRLLGRRGGEPGIRARLLQWIRDHEGRAALDGLWALSQAGGFDDPVAREAMRHPYAPVRAWAVRLLGDAPGISGYAAEQIAQLASREDDLEVWAQVASTAQRVPSGHAMRILGALLARSGDLADPYIPLLGWWAIEAHCDAGRAEVMALFDSPAIWEQGMVQREILPRLMRRFALQGRERDLLACARLLRLAPGQAQRARLMAGFEDAFAGGSLPHLPEELLAAIADSGAASLILRVRQGEAGAIEEAMAVAVNRKSNPGERLRYVKAFGEIGSEAPLQTLLDLVRREDDEDLRRAALASLQRFPSPDVAPVVIAAYAGMSGREKTAAEALLAGRAGWARALLGAVED
ncbi:MAG: dehydrogenase, partial [Akkermansiaceae bacterium]|nr:dehydrogenase [Akkermansiaceae bacterium]